MMSAPIRSFAFAVLVFSIFVSNVESSLVPRRARALAVAADGKRQLTNAERFARGLPPNKPLYRRSPALHARASATPTSSSTETSSPSPIVFVPVPSATPCPITGVMEVRLSNGQSGYWDAATSTEGATTGNIGLTTNPDRLAGIYSFDPCGSNPGNVQCLNCDTHDDFSVAGITLASRDNTELTSTDGTGYIQLTSSTLPNATAQRVPSAQSPNGEYPSESAVWNYDETTGILTPQWVNADGSVVKLAVSLAIESEGDINHFVVQYPTDNDAAATTGDQSGDNIHSQVVSLKITPQQH
ncbi:hypothetical protein BC629DRAFT_1434710 [Irpex lacteus]|nr:hypothetical protein BC629DRAFT_1434710 [Irpex lacteus]